jgi:hypothetical protein
MYEFPITILAVLILITANTFCDANYRMTSHSNAEQEVPTTGLPTTDSEFDVEEDAHSDVDEEMIKKWLSTTYERLEKAYKGASHSTLGSADQRYRCGKAQSRVQISKHGR